VNEKPRLHNHFNFLIDYNEFRKGEYRVVGIQVDPESLGGVEADRDWQRLLSRLRYAAAAKELSETGNSKVTWTYSVYWRPSEVTFRRAGTSFCTSTTRRSIGLRWSTAR